MCADAAEFVPGLAAHRLRCGGLGRVREDIVISDDESRDDELSQGQPVSGTATLVDFTVISDDEAAPEANPRMSVQEGAPEERTRKASCCCQ